jgi:hypothetical protein
VAPDLREGGVIPNGAQEAPMSINPTANTAAQRLQADDERTPMITPEQARAKMPSARARAVRMIAEEIESFIEAGNEHAVIVMPFDDIEDNAMIAELIDYQRAGWIVEFYRGCAAISLPEVVS